MRRSLASGTTEHGSWLPPWAPRPAVLGAALVLASAVPATSHPHVYIDATVNLVFDEEGRFVAIRQHWLFDYDFSDIVRSQNDADGNRRLDEAELATAATSNIGWAEENGFFTHVTLGGQPLEYQAPSEFLVSFERTRMAIDIALPLVTPVQLGVAAAGVDIYDPEIYYAIDFGGRVPHVEGTGLPPGCAVAKRTPGVQHVISPLATAMLQQAGYTLDEAFDPAAGYPVRVIVSCT